MQVRKPCSFFNFVLLFVLFTASLAVCQAANALLNINTAPLSELADQLPGIGPAKASAIVSYRETHGPFRTLDALTDVKGIGPATLSKIRAMLFIDENLLVETNADARPNSKKAIGDTRRETKEKTKGKDSLQKELPLLDSDGDGDQARGLTLSEIEHRTAVAVQAAVKVAKRAERQEQQRSAPIQGRRSRFLWPFFHELVLD